MIGDTGGRPNFGALQERFGRSKRVRARGHAVLAVLQDDYHAMGSVIFEFERSDRSWKIA